MENTNSTDKPSKANIKIGLVFVGKTEAERTLKRLTEHNLTDCPCAVYDNIDAFINGTDDYSAYDFVIAVADAKVFDAGNVDSFSACLKNTVSLTFVIGNIEEAKVKEALISSTRCICPDRDDDVEKYVAELIIHIIRLFTWHGILNLDLADLVTVISHKNNFIWLGKGYGPKKKDILIYQMKDSDWYQNILPNNKTYILAAISGDVTLGDCSDVLAIIIDSEDNPEVCFSLRYEDTFDEVTVMIIGSYE